MRHKIEEEKREIDRLRKEVNSLTGAKLISAGGSIENTSTFAPKENSSSNNVNPSSVSRRTKDDIDEMSEEQLTALYQSLKLENEHLRVFPNSDNF